MTPLRASMPPAVTVKGPDPLNVMGLLESVVFPTVDVRTTVELPVKLTGPLNSITGSPTSDPVAVAVKFEFWRLRAPSIPMLKALIVKFAVPIVVLVVIDAVGSTPNPPPAVKVELPAVDTI